MFTVLKAKNKRHSSLAGREKQDPVRHCKVCLIEQLRSNFYGLVFLGEGGNTWI